MKKNNEEKQIKEESLVEEVKEDLQEEVTKEEKKAKTEEKDIDLKEEENKEKSISPSEKAKKESVKFRKINFNTNDLNEKGNTKLKEEAFKDKTRFLLKAIFWVFLATLSIIFGIVVISDSITKIIDLSNDEVSVNFFSKIFKSIGLFLEAFLFIFYFIFSIIKFIDNWKLHLNAKKLFHALFYAETNSLDLYQNDINDIYKSYLIEKRIEKNKKELDKQSTWLRGEAKKSEKGKAWHGRLQDQEPYAEGNQKLMSRKKV